MLRISTNLTTSKILESCEDDGIGIYNLFQLQNKFDVDQWAGNVNIDDVSNSLREFVKVCN